MMGFRHQENNLNRRFHGGGGGGGGPTGGNNGGANEVVGHTYYHNVSSSSLVGENFARNGTNSQPFDIFGAAYCTTGSFKSPEGMMAASVAFPFTSAQWKELERQAMIYKYMISSLPVPPDLLFPLSRNFPASAVDSSASSLYNVRYTKNGDPEPGRCKRTDGKKWRCSRDVAPHQKYCERHLHRGRPRSRKHVEVKNNGENHKKTRVEQISTPNSSAPQHLPAMNDKPLLLFNPKSDVNISNAPSYKETNRDLGLMMMMEGEMVVVDGAEQRWQQLIESNVGFVDNGSSIYGSTPLLHEDYVVQQPLDLLSYSNFPALEIEASTGFIDASLIDSSGNVESSISTNQGNVSASLDLSIAMAAGSDVDQEMRSIRCCDEQCVKDSSRLSPVSWGPFSRGGPLAEALPATVGCKTPASPHDPISTAAIAVSSPTGVLHRTLFSHSDGSVCNSPTLVAPVSEVAFQRLN